MEITEKEIHNYKLGNDILKLINARFNTNYNCFIFRNDCLYLGNNKR